MSWYGRHPLHNQASHLNLELYKAFCMLLNLSVLKHLLGSISWGRNPQGNDATSYAPLQSSDSFVRTWELIRVRKAGCFASIPTHMLACNTCTILNICSTRTGSLYKTKHAIGKNVPKTLDVQMCTSQIGNLPKWPGYLQKEQPIPPWSLT